VFVSLQGSLQVSVHSFLSNLALLKGGTMPQIAVLNESTGITDNEIQKMLPAFAKQWNTDLKNVWGVDDATLTFVPKDQKPESDSWWLVFLDDSDQAGNLAYHDLTNEGLPLSKVFVKTIRDADASISVGATHELCEMAVDPWLNSAYQDLRGIFWAGEIADPVEDDQYGYEIDGILVSAFVTPNWFGHQHAQSEIDVEGHARVPFEVLSGGYAQIFDPQQGWVQVTGSKARRSKMSHAAEGSRRERRARQSRGRLERSHPVWGKRK
jgi:hypothetical protein